MPWPTSIASASRVNASTTVSAFKRHRSNSASETKSIDHSLLGAEASGWRSRLAALTSSTRTLEPKAQSILPIQPVDPLVVYEPAHPAQQDVDPKIAITGACCSQIVDAQPQRRRIRLVQHVAHRRAIDAERQATAPLADTRRRLGRARRSRAAVQASELFSPEHPAGYACLGSGPRRAASACGLGFQLSIYRKTKGKLEANGGGTGGNIASKGSHPSSRGFTTCVVPSAGGVRRRSGSP